VTERNITVPPEWAPQKAIWTAWPADPDEWNGDLEAPRRDVAALVRGKPNKIGNLRQINRED
jgi:agmatine/peptidylarginine deiminase